MPARLPAAAALLALLALLAAGGARAQGVVLGPEGRSLPVRRVRALIVFQERGNFPHRADRPNRENLLVEVELAAPAPKGALWVLACPADGAAARPGDAAALEEVSAFWRKAEKSPEKEPWPEGGAAALELGRPSNSAAFGAIEKTVAEGWRAFAAEVPAGAKRIGPAHLAFNSLVTVYPGALGAVPGGEEGRELWRLPKTELMVLHPYFINVSDNRSGLAPALGLKKLYQDPGTLQESKALWYVPPRTRPGGKPAPGRMRGAAGRLEAAGRLLGSLGTRGDLFLTVVAGRPERPGRGELDFSIFSHYPSAVETTGSGAGLLWLVGSLVVLVVLMGFLLKRRGFAQ